MKKALLAAVAVAVIGVAATATLTQTRAAGNLANEAFDASLTAAASQTVDLAFDVSAAGALEEGDTIFVDVPEALAATSVSATMDDFSGNAMTLASNVLSYTLGSGETVADSATVTISMSMDLDSTPYGGVYSFAIYTEDGEEAVIDEGSALLSVDNTVAVTAEVLEAIIMTLDKNAINLQADPAVNGGEVDSTESNTFSISSNAAGGFELQQEIDGALTGATHGATIANDNTPGAENIFAYNLDGSGEDSAFSTTAASTGITDLTATDAGSQTAVGGRNVGTFEDTVHYYLNIDFSTPADTYDGAITYTIVPTF